MSRWFRFYSEALDDPKVQLLDGETFKAWVNILCLAARNDGVLPDLSGIAFALRIDNIAAGSLIDRLHIGGLIDHIKGGANGSRIAPHGWHKRQYKSDTSSDRVKRYRERSKEVTETPPEQKQIQSIPLSKDNGDSDKKFWDDAKSYLGPSKASAIGKWVGAYGKDATAKAITAAQIARAVDPIPYIQRVLKRADDAGSGMPC